MMHNLRGAFTAFAGNLTATFLMTALAGAFTAAFLVAAFAGTFATTLLTVVFAFDLTGAFAIVTPLIMND
jgi:hypothetical protein